MQKKAFGGPAFVIEYLGRYTHKICIGNYRIVNVSEFNFFTANPSTFLRGEAVCVASVTLRALALARRSRLN
jgi:hypothetical protein